MTFDDFTPNPLRLESSDFVGPLPLVKHVLAHFLYLTKDAEEREPGKWTKSNLYNATAEDLLTLCACSDCPASVVKWVKPKISE